MTTALHPVISQQWQRGSRALAQIEAARDAFTEILSKLDPECTAAEVIREELVHLNHAADLIDGLCISDFEPAEVTQ